HTMTTYDVGQLELGSTFPASVDSTWFFLPLEMREPHGTRYVVMNLKDIWFETDRSQSVWTPEGAVVYRTPHPRQLFIYQYHGYPESVRRWLRGVDFSIRIVDRQAAGAREPKL